MSLIDQLRKKVKTMEHVTTGTLMAEAERKGIDLTDTTPDDQGETNLMKFIIVLLLNKKSYMVLDHLKIVGILWMSS